MCACSPGARECKTLQTVSFASRRRWPEPPAPGWDRTRLDRPTCVCRGAAIETQASDANMVTSRSRTHFPQPSPGAFPAPGSASTVAHVREAGADQRPVLIPTIFGSASDRRTASCEAPSAQRPYRPNVVGSCPRLTRSADRARRAADRQGRRSPVPMKRR